MSLFDSEQRAGAGSHAHTHLMVPILVFFALLIFAVIRGPNLISAAGIGSAVIVAAPLILATYALTIIVMAGRASVDLSMGPLIGFINVGMIQLFGGGYMDSPIAFFLYAMGVGVAYQVLLGLIIIFVRVQPIIVSLSGYLALVGLNLVIMPRPGGVAPDWMFPWGSGTTIFSPVLAILVLATIGWYLLTRTAFFGHLRMMGSDERAAYASGVHIYWVRLGAHAIGGVYAGLAAITFTSLISSGDPTQGTTYTLMAVTALVLGGANLAGGRGGAFGSLLGALNIYLVTYALSTFSFGMVQSFVTDLAYGLMLVLSLLISLAVPHIQRQTRGLSPMVFFVILSVVALGVIMHTSMDRVMEPLIGVSASSIVLLEDGGVAQVSGATDAGAYSPGTYILFIIIGITVIAYAFRTLFKHTNVHMIGLLLVLAVAGLGLIFSPDTPPDTADQATAVASAPSTDAGQAGFSPAFFALETLDDRRAVGAAVIQTTYAIITVAGAVLLASLIILLALPQVSVRTKRIALFLFAAAVGIVAVGALFFDSSRQGYLTSSLSGEFYALLLAGVLLFVITAPLVHTRFRNVSTIFYAAMGALAVIAVYFFTAPGAGLPANEADRAAAGYAEPVILTEVEPAAPATIDYPVPVRVGGDARPMATYAQLAYCALLIVLLHIVVRVAMGETSFRAFWRYWHIATFGVLLWSGLFFVVGTPLWKIAVVIGIAMLSAPNVMHILSTYLVGVRRDHAISQWSG